MVELLQLALTTELEEKSSELAEQSVINEVLDKFQAIAAECEQWHDYINRNRKLYLLWGGDDNIYDITISKPHNIVTFAKSVLLAAEYKPQAIAFVEVDEEAQSSYEKFALGIWKTQEERQDNSLEDAFVHSLCVDGVACLHLYPDRDFAPNNGELHWGKNPITMEVVDSLDVYPCLSKNPKRPFDYIIYKYQESLYNLRNQWPTKNWNTYGVRLDDGREVSEREYFIDVYTCYSYDANDYVVQTICTDKILLADEVLWHSSELPLPWIIESCYTGTPPREGNGGIALISKYQSILHPIDDDVQTAEHLLSADMRAVDLYGNMPPVVKTVGGRHVKIDPEWGEVVELSTEESLGFPQWPGNPPDSSRILGYVHSDMAEASFSSAAMGMAGSSASGYQVALTTESSRTRLYLPGRSFARAIKKAAYMAAKMLGFYWPDTTFHMYGMGANGQYQTFGFHPKMADGLTLECIPTMKMPGDDVRKTAIATQHRAIGLPLSVILSDDLGYKQPDDIMRKIRQEKIDQHPLVALFDLLQQAMLDPTPFGQLKAQIIREALIKAMGGMVQGVQGQMGMQTPPQFRPPGQQPNLAGMGTQVAPPIEQGATGLAPDLTAMGTQMTPLTEQGIGPFPGQTPANIPVF